MFHFSPGDYNRISLDAAIGGCFGETLSAFETNFDYDFDIPLIKEYLNGIAMDEIQHASLAWVTVKWIIDQSKDKVEVSDTQWWKQQLSQRRESIANDYIYVYDVVIPSILKVLSPNNSELKEDDYVILYNDIHQLLKNHLDIYSQKNN